MRLIHPRWCNGIKEKHSDRIIRPEHLVEERDMADPSRSDGAQRCGACQRKAVKLGIDTMNPQCGDCLRAMSHA